MMRKITGAILLFFGVLLIGWSSEIIGLLYCLWGSYYLLLLPK